MRARMTVGMSLLILFCCALGVQAAREPFRSEVMSLVELGEGVLSADEMAAMTFSRNTICSISLSTTNPA